MRKVRVLAANLAPFDVVRGITVATVIGDRTAPVIVAGYRPDGRRKTLTFSPGVRVTAHRPEEEEEEETCSDA